MPFWPVFSPPHVDCRDVQEGLEIPYARYPEAQDRWWLQALTDVLVKPASRHRLPHEFFAAVQRTCSHCRGLWVLQRILDPSWTSNLGSGRTVQKQVIELLQSLSAK